MTRNEQQVQDAVLVELFECNIRTVVAHALPSELEHGCNWYAEARQFARDLANRYGIGETVACYVVSALSPNNSWDGNKRDAENVVRAFVDGRPVESLTGITTYGQNVRKAYDVLRTGNCALVHANKTASFAHNIAFPDSREVTIDSHAYSIATGIRYTAQNCPSITDRRYRNARLAYQNVADTLGYAPYQVQAIAWVVWHRLIAEHATETVFTAPQQTALEAAA